jgi:chromosomal replication initiation ATPase DnaA
MKDHSAVSKAMSEINKTINADATFKAVIEELSNKISKN